MDRAQNMTIVAALTLAPIEEMETWLRERGVYLRQSEIDDIRMRLINDAMIDEGIREMDP